MKWLQKSNQDFPPMDMSLSKLWGMVKRTGKPGMLQSMGSQRIGHDWETKQQQGQVGTCASYFTAQTNVNADSGPVGFRKATQVLLLLPLVCDTHSDPLPLRWKLVLWFPFILTDSYRGTQKDLEFLLGINRVRWVYMKFFLFPTSFVTFIL